MNEGHVQGDCPVCGFFPLRSVSSVVWKKKYENRLYATLLTERRHLYKMAFGGRAIGIASIRVCHPQTRSSTPSGQHSLAHLIHASCVLHFPHYAGLFPTNLLMEAVPIRQRFSRGVQLRFVPDTPADRHSRALTSPAQVGTAEPLLPLRRSAQQSPCFPCTGRHSRALASPAQVGIAEPLRPLHRSAQQSPCFPCAGGIAEPLLPLPRSAYFDHPLIWQGIYKIIVPQYPAASQVHPFLHSLYG